MWGTTNARVMLGSPPEFIFGKATLIATIKAYEAINIPHEAQTKEKWFDLSKLEFIRINSQDFVASDCLVLFWISYFYNKDSSFNNLSGLYWNSFITTMKKFSNISYESYGSQSCHTNFFNMTLKLNFLS